MAANNGLVFPSPWKLTMSSFSIANIITLKAAIPANA
jgi:hypothetical protein